jgi:hypothetical protein
MLVTVTNVTNVTAWQTSRTINNPDFYEGYPGVPPITSAVGGNVTDPLPYPFDQAGPLAAGSAVTLPMRDRDWYYSRSLYNTQYPHIKWQQLVQAGVVTMAFASETNQNDEQMIFDRHAV